jgi:hypothetical protein
MASDISLAVGDGARRMTYTGLAAVRGVSAASAERLVRRWRWPRQAGNDGVVRVLVPLEDARDRRKSADSRVSPDKEADVRTSARTSPLISAPDIPRTVRTLESAIEALREQLRKADQREEAERGRADRTERHLEELREALADAVAAERIAAGEAARLRAQAEDRRAWRLLRRLGWALRDGDRAGPTTVCVTGSPPRPRRSAG